MISEKFGKWPPLGFKTIEEYVNLMDTTGLWGSKEYARKRMMELPLDLLNEYQKLHATSPVEVWYTIQAVINYREMVLNE